VTLEETSVARLAEELDGEERRAALQAGLAALAPAVAGRTAVASALDDLRGDGDLAWRCFAAARLAASLT
jgi:hypothetical protein